MNYVKEDELLAWLDACTSPDTVRQVLQTATARKIDLQQARGSGDQPPEGAHLLQPHVAER